MDVFMILLAWFGGCIAAGMVVVLVLGGVSRFRRKMWTAWRRGRNEDGD